MSKAKVQKKRTPRRKQRTVKCDQNYLTGLRAWTPAKKPKGAANG